MREHVRLGRILGIPIGLNLSVVVIIALVVDLVATQTLPGTVHGYAAGAYWAIGLLVGALFFASLLAHELAHSVVARRYGVKVERITLWMLGGVTEFAGEPVPCQDSSEGAPTYGSVSIRGFWHGTGRRSVWGAAFGTKASGPCRLTDNTLELRRHL